MYIYFFKAYLTCDHLVRSRIAVSVKMGTSHMFEFKYPKNQALCGKAVKALNGSNLIFIANILYDDI